MPFEYEKCSECGTKCEKDEIWKSKKTGEKRCAYCLGKVKKQRKKRQMLLR